MTLLNRDPVSTKILDAIRSVSKQLAEMKGERDAVSEELGLSTRVVSLEREKTKKEIELDRVKEQHERERREIEHMVGLHKKRTEQEIEIAKREQVVTLREENLKADRDRFEQQMEFMQKRMEGELERLNGLTSEILDRLPKIEFNRTVEERYGSNGNGHDLEEVEA
jgi:SMC interacting uncharacterized protein involved in chromosome segregation